MPTEAVVDTAALDAWLAEHLFGWVWRLHEQEDHLARSIHAPGMREDAALAKGDEPLYINSAFPERPGLSNLSAAWSYSTTGDGMLMQMVALQGQGFVVNVTMIPADDPYHGGEAECVIERHNNQISIDWHPEAPTAVALAARAALEAGV